MREKAIYFFVTTGFEAKGYKSREGVQKIAYVS
jgi:hypothetical protein